MANLDQAFKHHKAAQVAEAFGLFALAADLYEDAAAQSPDAAYVLKEKAEHARRQIPPPALTLVKS